MIKAFYFLPSVVKILPIPFLPLYFRNKKEVSENTKHYQIFKQSATYVTHYNIYKLMRRFLKISLIFLFFSFFSILFGCATLARKETRLSISIEKAYLKGESAKAIELIKEKLDKSKAEEQLLFLMEAGTILHTTGQYQRSNGAFLAAEKIIESFNLSEDSELLLSDVKKPFRGENFEHVLVRLYIAFNYIMLGQKESALIYFRRVNQYLAQIKTFDAFYKQNYAARFLYALLAEELKNYNDARVQYNNLKQNNLLDKYVDQGLGVISQKEQIEENLLLGKDRQSILLGQESEEIFYYEPVYDDDGELILEKRFLEPKDVDLLEELGSLVVVHSHGFPPIKVSRGTLGDEGYLGGLLVTSVAAALISRGKVGLSSTFIFSIISSAENPVPLYEKRKNKKINFDFQLGDDLLLEMQKFDDYTDTVLKNYNENYQTIVEKNRENLVAKIVAAILSTEIISLITSQVDEGWGLFAGIAGGIVAGSVLKETIYPDLRSWRLMYDSLYIDRILIREGVYPFGVVKPSAASRFILDPPKEVTIKKGENTYVMLRSY